MTVPATTRKAGPYTGNGVQTVYPYAFKVFAITDVKVVSADLAGVETVLSSGFTVSMNADQVASPGGNVTLSAALTSGYKLTVLGNLPYDQTLALPGGGNFNPVVVENTFDRLVTQVQQLAEAITRKFGLSATTTTSAVLPAPALGSAIGWDSVGNLVNIVLSAGTSLANLAAAAGAGLIGWFQSGTGAVLRTVQDKLRESVSVKDFGAVCDGATDDTAAVQAAINYCATFSEWPALLVPGKCLITSSLNINRAVDTTTSDFHVIGRGPGAGFYTTSAVTVFDSTIAYGSANSWGALAPVSENIVFDKIQFETSVAGTASYAMSGKFLRVKFNDCRFQSMKCANATTAYLQTWYFLNCTIRYCNTQTFLVGLGSFDVSFLHNIIENNYRLFYSAPNSPGGNAGFRLIDNVIEGTNVVSGVGTLGVSGMTGCVIAHNHIEQNFNADFNFGAGTGVSNPSILIEGNFIVCDTGKVAFYHWTSTGVTSIGNVLMSTGGVAGQLHNQVARVTNFISVNDTVMNSGTLSDVAPATTIGAYKSSSASEALVPGLKSSGNIGVGTNSLGSVRAYVAGASSTSSDYAAVFTNSGGFDIAQFRNDRVVVFPAIQAYANDAAAAAAGIPIGGLYRIANAIQIRLV